MEIGGVRLALIPWWAGKRPWGTSSKQHLNDQMPFPLCIQLSTLEKARDASVLPFQYGSGALLGNPSNLVSLVFSSWVHTCGPEKALVA